MLSHRRLSLAFVLLHFILSDTFMLVHQQRSKRQLTQPAKTTPLLHTADAHRAANHRVWMLLTPLPDTLPQWLFLPGAMFALVNLAVLTILYKSFELFTDGSGAPFVPIAAQKLERLFERESGVLSANGEALRANGARPDQLHLIDLGSGSGSIVRTATRVGGFGRSSGYEINPWLYCISTLGSLGRPNECIHLVSLWEAPLGDADVVVVYGYPTFIERLGTKLGAELKEGAVVVSNAYSIPESVPHLQLIDEIAVETPPWDPDASSSLWLYRVARPAERGAAPRPTGSQASLGSCTSLGASPPSTRSSTPYGY